MNRLPWVPSRNLILASRSPRRIELLSALGIPFTLQHSDIPEEYPAHLSMTEIPEYLAQRKAAFFEGTLSTGDLLVTADTIVWLNGEVLGKPASEEEAYAMLLKLSGRVHQVVTGVCLMSTEKQKTFSAVTHVTFKTLAEQEILYYIRNFHPFDKAGAYGIQEWIGLAGITRIEGSYFNVVGLPIHDLYREIMAF